jgi:competence CoiA-like predicted nuclease
LKLIIKESEGMINDNINVWFARNKEGNIVTIDKINEDNRYEEYSCPICESKLIPKLGDINAHHLAHKDASKCDRETQIHFFVKNELLKQGDKFTVKLDNEIKEFI